LSYICHKSYEHASHNDTTFQHFQCISFMTEYKRTHKEKGPNTSTLQHS